jgi:uncharacterized protein
MSRFGLVLAPLVLAGCSQPAAPRCQPSSDAFDRTALLDHLAHRVLLPIQADVDAKVRDLPAAIAAHCAALDAGTPGTTLEAARAVFADAVDTWQRADALLIGPAAMDDSSQRDRIYAFPAQAPCDLDRDVVARWTAPESYDLSTKAARQRSLLAIEYLLYNTASAHSCPIEPAGWSALGADLPRARCRLAEVLAIDVAEAARELHVAWQPDGGDYAGVIASAGCGSVIPSPHAGVNLVSNAFFYVDRMVKDMKLAETTGISMHNACGVPGEPCLREVELRYADRATFAIRANLRALREGFTGTTADADGPGFDDFLIAVGHPDVAARMTASLDTAIAAADALSDSFLDALATDYAGVVALHGKVRDFTDDLKSQFLTLLALDIPDDVASDND